MSYTEHFGEGRPVPIDAFVKTLRMDRSETGWEGAFMVDWSWIGHDTDVIGYKVAGPLRTIWLSLRLKFGDR
ncbi:hypothetical protein [Aureimonas sp. AU40]|uniref:hypothetical protein n=1 Tax=Aureimonas sp. AU40 TaxID=1637747 RepID=UPI000785F36D|nr:hypothetical protein [Aureimonas sp. AU40]